ncbi:hypothetical protein VDS02_14045, partial [Xanthomonas campestris pv. campestris]|nr:hypothetical protein [Xanthomonas campestris pv. campestris]MEB1406488.1 hypothetical protein [Xanthomonas campestris pv. campestris]MEB1425754.1 hypothetical protein [Xanthomonas campestris pv. campestris]MEB1520267.1 hypothetical protein [Xanthomonas campestris pv. campestris]MEB1772057.1 hypothetical protein [Xanthomonas campestris pv. campestris]
MPELLQLAGVVAMSICGLLGSLGLRLSSGRGLCKADHGRAQGGDQQCYPNHHQMPATSVVAPEKPPITQRPQGLDVCSGVPELP